MCSTTYRERYRLEIRIGIAEVCQHCFTNEKIFFNVRIFFNLACLLATQTIVNLSWKEHLKNQLMSSREQKMKIQFNAKCDKALKDVFSPSAAAKHSKFKANKSYSFSKLEKIFQKSFILLNLRFCWWITRS